MEESSTVFFFGAGASVAAGVPDTRGFVDAFRKSLASEPEMLKEADALLKIIGEASGEPDIEALLEALDFLDPETRKNIPALAVSAPTYTFSKTTASELRRRLHDLILRRAVVHPSDIGYLDSLSDFFESKVPLDIFSVNYDTCVELFCHTRRIKFTDGFGVEWRPSEFRREDIQLRLIKLHGSVLWYETSTGACVRIPVVPTVGEHTLFTHEAARPLMLYPARKWAYAEPLLQNLELFRTRLSDQRTRNIVVVGYSFRDDHLRKIFFDALRSNLDVRIVLISPSAWDIYRSRLEFLDAEKTIPSPARNRVVCLPYRFQTVFPLLKEKLRALPSAAAVNGRTSWDWGTTLESALKSEDLASAIAVAPRVGFTYAQADGTKRAVKAYVMIRLLEAAHGREFLSLFPRIEVRFREIVGNVNLEVHAPGHPAQFQLDSRVVLRDDGTSERTQPLGVYDVKFVLDWTLQEFEPLLKAADALEKPVVKRIRVLRDRLAQLASLPVTEYERLSIPYLESAGDRERYQPQVARAIELLGVSNPTNNRQECRTLCEIEQLLLAQLTSLPHKPAMPGASVASA